MGRMLENLAGDALLTVAPLLIATVVAALVTPFLVGGWVFTTKVLRFDLTRLDPCRAWADVFDPRPRRAGQGQPQGRAGGRVGVWVVWRERDHLFALMLQPLATSMDDFASLVLLSSLLIVASLALIAAIDVPFQLWEYHRRCA
jgi:flagellar biosynthetic protein FlhB